MLKSIEELGEDLCEYCPLEENERGARSTPSGTYAGCEGSHCKEAYQYYIEGEE